MIFLYILELLAIAVLFVPEQFMPYYVKWPIALVVIVVITFVFNLMKKDTIYITRDIKRTSMKRGLMHPWMMYTGVSFYLCGLIFLEHGLAANDASDIVKNIGKIPTLFNFNQGKEVIVGVLLLVLGITCYFLKWLTSHKMSKVTLKARAISYIVLFVLSCAAYLVTFWRYSTIDFYPFFKIGYNLWIFYGLALLVFVIDLIIFFVLNHKEAKALKATTATETVESTVETVETPVEETSEAVVEETAVMDRSTRKFKKRNKKQRKIIERVVNREPIETAETSNEATTVEETPVEETIETVENETTPSVETQEVPVETTEPTEKPLSKHQQKVVAKERAKQEKKQAKELAKLQKEMDAIRAKSEKKKAKEARKKPEAEPSQEALAEEPNIITPTAEEVTTQVVEESTTDSPKEE